MKTLLAGINRLSVSNVLSGFKVLVSRVDLAHDDRAHLWRKYRFEAAHQLPNVPEGISAVECMVTVLR